MDAAVFSVIALALLTLIGAAGNLAQILEWWEIRHHAFGITSQTQMREERARGRARPNGVTFACEERLEQLLGEGIDQALRWGYTTEEIQAATNKCLFAVAADKVLTRSRKSGRGKRDLQPSRS